MLGYILCAIGAAGVGIGAGAAVWKNRKGIRSWFEEKRNGIKNRVKGRRKSKGGRSIEKNKKNRISEATTSNYQDARSEVWRRVYLTLDLKTAEEYEEGAKALEAAARERMDYLRENTEADMKLFDKIRSELGCFAACAYEGANLGLLYAHMSNARNSIIINLVKYAERAARLAESDYPREEAYYNPEEEIEKTKEAERCAKEGRQVDHTTAEKSGAWKSADEESKELDRRYEELKNEYTEEKERTFCAECQKIVDEVKEMREKAKENRMSFLQKGDEFKKEAEMEMKKIEAYKEMRTYDRLLKMLMPILGEIAQTTDEELKDEEKVRGIGKKLQKCIEEFNERASEKEEYRFMWLAPTDERCKDISISVQFRLAEVDCPGLYMYSAGEENETEELICIGEGKRGKDLEFRM